MSALSKITGSANFVEENVKYGLEEEKAAKKAQKKELKDRDDDAR